MLTLDPVLSPKLLATGRLHGDVPTQGYDFKTGIKNCLNELGSQSNLSERKKKLEKKRMKQR